MWFRLWAWLKMMRKDLLLLLIAYRNPGMPRHLKMVFLGALLYLISPVDLIPDYLPIVGVVDDLTIIPAVLYYINRMLPIDVKRESEHSISKLEKKMPYILLAIAILLVLWVVFIFWGIYCLFK